MTQLCLGVISEGQREEHHLLAATPASFASHTKIRREINSPNKHATRAFIT